MFHYMQRIRLSVQYRIWKAMGYLKSYDTFFDCEYKNGFKYTKALGYIKLGYEPNLNSPKSCCEKLIHRRLFSRDPIWPIVMEKVSVRDWIIKNNLNSFVKLVPLFDVISDPDKHDLSLYSEPVVIKAAWASGLNIFICKNSENLADLRGILCKWRDQIYHPERLIWAVNQMPRRFIVEKMLLKDDGGVPEDFKFYVLHGKVEIIQIIMDRYKEKSMACYDRNLNLLDLKRRGAKVAHYDLPAAVGDMVIAAEEFGKHFDFVRIDFYYYNNNIYFGEITPAPSNGFAQFDPVKFDFELGKKWNYSLPSDNPYISGY